MDPDKEHLHQTRRHAPLVSQVPWITSILRDGNHRRYPLVPEIRSFDNVGPAMRRAFHGLVWNASQHLPRRGTLQPPGRGVRATPKCVARSLQNREEVSSIYTDRRAAGEPKPLSVLVDVDRDHINLVLYPFLR